MRGLRRFAFALAIAAAASASSTDAHAALTSSEKAQIRDFYRSATMSQAGRIRALVARPDLSATESSDALREATEPLAWTNERAALLREISFGTASDASRSVLAPAMTRASLARADVALAKLANAEDARALAEVTAIYTFLLREVAEKSDAVLPRTTRDDCVKAVAEHIEKNARALRPDGGATTMLGLRAQAEVLLFEMVPEGPTRRLDTADKLGLKGARRQFMIEWGILVVDGKAIADAKIAQLHSIFERLPGARTDVTAITLGDVRTVVVARGRVLPLATDLGAPVPSFWSEEVGQGDTSAAAGAIGEIARIATQSVLSNRGELRTRAQADAALTDREHPFGKPTDPTVEATVAAALQLLLVDGARAFDWALARFVSAKPESAAILSDALGVLAALSPRVQGNPPELVLPLGKPGAPNATAPIDVLPATTVRLFPNGAVSQLTFGGHSYAFDRDETTGAVRAVRRDGEAVTLANLSSARTPMSDTSSWTYGGVAFARLTGSPRAGMGPGPHVRLESQSPLDAIATPPPASDFVLEGELTVENGEGGVGVRAKTLRDTRQKLPKDVLFGGFVALDTSASAPRIALQTSEEGGRIAFMAAPANGPFASPMHLRIEVKGTKIDARVGNATFHGTLPQSMMEGSIVLFARSGAKVELQNLHVTKL
jgi:hypothetical protein